MALGTIQVPHEFHFCNTFCITIQVLEVLTLVGAKKISPSLSLCLSLNMHFLLHAHIVSFLLFTIPLHIISALCLVNSMNHELPQQLKTTRRRRSLIKNKRKKGVF
jgi:hypothetical protein